MNLSILPTRRRRSVKEDPPPYNDDAIVAKAKEILAGRMRRGREFTSPGVTRDFLTLHFAGHTNESFVVVYLDNRHRLIEAETLFFGTIDGASVYPRVVAQAALRYNAAAVILAHNHPSGLAEPSQSDRTLTTRLKETLWLLDVRVLDHFVVGGAEAYSFAEHGLL